MIKRKGFIHVLEALIATMMILIFIPFFLFPNTPEAGWDRKKLVITGEDLLASLDKTGFLGNIMQYNSSEIKKRVENALGNETIRIGFNMKTRGALKNKITVGFNCTGCDAGVEKNKIENILTPTYVNGRKIEFDVYPFIYENLGKLDYDVIFLNGTNQVDEAAKEDNLKKIRETLQRGKGIVEFVNLDDISIGDLQKEIFGINDKDGIIGAGEKINFTNNYDPYKKNYYIQKYFHAVGSDVGLIGENGEWKIWDETHEVKLIGSDEINVSKITGGWIGPFKENDTFSLIHDGVTYNFSVEKINSSSRVWFNHLPEYVFDKDSFTGKVPPPDYSDSGVEMKRRVLIQEDNKKPIVVINYTTGRAVWVSEGTGDDVRGLVKSSVIWAAGEDYWNVFRTVSGEEVEVSYFTFNNQEFFEPYKVVLSLWYLY